MFFEEIVHDTYGLKPTTLGPQNSIILMFKKHCSGQALLQGNYDFYSKTAVRPDNTLSVHLSQAKTHSTQIFNLNKMTISNIQTNLFSVSRNLGDLSVADFAGRVTRRLILP